jgi:hypothetical protein
VIIVLECMERIDHPHSYRLPCCCGKTGDRSCCVDQYQSRDADEYFVRFWGEYYGGSSTHTCIKRETSVL